jgi:hypothetical protein
MCNFRTLLFNSGGDGRDLVWYIVSGPKTVFSSRNQVAAVPRLVLLVGWRCAEQLGAFWALSLSARIGILALGAGSALLFSGLMHINLAGLTEPCHVMQSASTRTLETLWFYLLCNQDFTGESFQAPRTPSAC